MSKRKHHQVDSALNVQKGIDQPAKVNPNVSEEFDRFKKDRLTSDIIYDGIISGEIGRAHV